MHLSGYRHQKLPARAQCSENRLETASSSRPVWIYLWSAGARTQARVVPCPWDSVAGPSALPFWHATLFDVYTNKMNQQNLQPSLRSTSRTFRSTLQAATVLHLMYLCRCLLCAAAFLNLQVRALLAGLWLAVPDRRRSTLLPWPKLNYSVEVLPPD
jgi:hypothetical protein